MLFAIVFLPSCEIPGFLLIKRALIVWWRRPDGDPGGFSRPSSAVTETITVRSAYPPRWLSISKATDRALDHAVQNCRRSNAARPDHAPNGRCRPVSQGPLSRMAVSVCRRRQGAGVQSALLGFAPLLAAGSGILGSSLEQGQGRCRRAEAIADRLFRRRRGPGCWPTPAA